MAVTTEVVLLAVTVTGVPAATGTVADWELVPSPVTVTVDESTPSATAVVGLAVTVERAALGAVAWVGAEPSPGLAPLSPAVGVIQKAWEKMWGWVKSWVLSPM